MKIRPTAGGTPKIPSVDRAGGAKAAGARGKRAEPVAPAAPERSAAADAAGRVAARLRAGEIAPKEAISLLVEATLEGLSSASPALRKRMRPVLERIAGEDPGLLAALDRARRGR